MAIREFASHGYTFEVLEQCPVCGQALRMRLKEGEAVCEALKFSVRAGDELPVVCKCAYDRHVAEREAVGKGRPGAVLAPSVHRLEMTFANSSVPLEIQGVFCDTFEGSKEQGQGLVLQGPKGTGKTFAAYAICNELASRGYRCLVTSESRIYHDVTQSMAGRQERIDAYADHDLVVIDDYGTSRDSQAVREAVLEVVDLLYMQRVPTVVTTNLTEREAQAMDARAWDRIEERCFPVVMTERIRADTSAEAFAEMARRFS
jgi:DNA replication protein DnaC